MDKEGEDVTGNGHQNDVFHDAEDGICNPDQDEDQGDALGNARAYYGQVVAPMPVSKDATHYRMDHPKRGMALIFNHENFTCGGLRSRSGTNEDCKNLVATLKALHFDVVDHKDLKYNELEEHIKNVSRMNHTNHDCLLIAILSHGEMGIVYAKDSPYKPEHLFSYFTADKCPTLAGKPKIFLLQACQGDKLDGGATLQKGGRTETDGESHTSYRIPLQADFLIVYSTVKGYYSWRNTTKGSWFIQSLCSELRDKGFTHDLLTILTFVSQRVAIDFESNVPDSPTMHRQKQIPCIMSMLIRLVQFQDKKQGYGTSRRSVRL